MEKSSGLSFWSACETEKRFSDPAELKAQIERDVERAREILQKGDK